MARVSSANVGLALAVLAGCVAIGQAVWPGSPPQAESLNFWLPLSLLSGAAFLLGAILADRYTVLSKALLGLGGLALIASGIYFGAISGGGSRSFWSTVADLLPGLLGLAAAVLIGPVRRRAMP